MLMSVSTATVTPGEAAVTFSQSWLMIRRVDLSKHSSAAAAATGGLAYRKTHTRTSSTHTHGTTDEVMAARDDQSENSNTQTSSLHDERWID